MKRAIAAAALFLAAAAFGQAPADAPACPEPVEVAPAHLYGLWRAEFEGTGHAGTLLLEPHPVYALSLRGTINRNGERSLLVADIEDGELTLEESADGRRIAATWLGDVVPGSCGREIRGTWQADGAQEVRRFVLRKVERQVPGPGGE